MYSIRSFNPRTHKGATSRPVSVSLPSRSFNPRTHKGATEQERIKLAERMFQSTHPQGCDQRCSGHEIYESVSIHAPTRVRPAIGNNLFGITKGFNPRTHKGATAMETVNEFVAQFQSTHPQGCDFLKSLLNELRCVSIHAPTRVRPYAFDMYIKPYVFQSTHPQGCDWVANQRSLL